MAVLFTNFTQPTELGGDGRLTLVGDPDLENVDELLFVGYGYYRIAKYFERDGDDEAGAITRDYRVQLVEKYSTASVIPAGTVAVVLREGVTHDALAFNSTISLSFKESDYRSLFLTGDISFSAQHHAPARSITVKILNNTSSHSLAFPSSWIFLGAKPNTIAPSKTGVLSITSFGFSDAQVVAVWAVQA